MKISECKECGGSGEVYNRTSHEVEECRNCKGNGAEVCVEKIKKYQLAESYKR